MTTAVGRIARRGGSISLTWMPEQDVLLVEGKGYVGLGMVREDLQRAGTFGKEHSNGWTYIADTSKVRLANPLNLIYLRRIPLAEPTRLHHGRTFMGATGGSRCVVADLQTRRRS